MLFYCNPCLNKILSNSLFQIMIRCHTNLKLTRIGIKTFNFIPIISNQITRAVLSQQLEVGDKL
jgi:hypothetical protein